MTAKPAKRPPLAMAVSDQEQPGTLAICIRGRCAQPGAKVPRGFIAVVEPAAPRSGPSVSGRLELAEWLASPRESADGPRGGQPHLAAPVRPGAGGTPDNFGTRGERPSHPELLDYLAGGSWSRAGRSSG